MDPNPQELWEAGAIVEVEVQLVAGQQHHRTTGGHFVFKACAISHTTEVPTQECFNENPLEFVSDELYGANKDANYPERVYVAPERIWNTVSYNNSGISSNNSMMVFRYKLKLPEGVVGDLVLLQWYHVESNDGVCVHEGYAEYNWPHDWIIGSDTDNGNNGDTDAKVGTELTLPYCHEVLSDDGNGVPEQFWNCAEVTITAKDDPMKNQILESPIPITRTHSKTIIGYYAGAQWYNRQQLAAPSNMDFSKVTRVNFAFFQTDKHGSIWGTDSWADPNILFGPYNWNPSEQETKHEFCSWDTPNTQNCKTHYYEEGLIFRAHAAGAEVYPSVGGWKGMGSSDPFMELAKEDGARRRFAEKCVELIESYGFDGVDIDWEYPVSKDDTNNYNLLLRDIRLKLDELGQRTGKVYGLTAALPCGPDVIANIDIQTVAQYLTELNLMTYDFFGAWSSTTGANAPLYDQDWGGKEESKDFSVDGCVRNWMKGGGSPSKINIGLPFHGSSFLKAKGLNEEHQGTDKNTWFWDDGSPQYYNIVDKLPDLVSVRHELTKTQYAYKDTSMGGLVSYDDEQAICDKTEYCLYRELNGFIIWELSGDLMPDLSTPLLDAVNSKLADPTLDCESFAYIPDSESPTISPQQNVVPNNLPSPSAPQNVVTNNSQPLSEPSAISATAPMYCPDGFTGPRQNDLCTGYYHCVYGTPTSVIKCPDGTLFDEKSMLCLYRDSVTCSETSSPTITPSEIPPTSTPSKSPTGLPTLPPSPRPMESITDAPVFYSNVILGDKEQDKPSPPTPNSVIPAASASLEENTSAIQEEPVPGGSGFKKNPSKPKPKLTSKPSRQPTLMPSTNPITEAELAILSLTGIPTSQPQTNKLSHPPTKPPLAQPAFATSLAQSLIENNYTPQKSPNFDSKPTSSPSPSVVPFTQYESPSEDNNKEQSSYSWSSSSNSSSSTENTYVPNTPLPQDFDLEPPFIIIELTLNDSPGDVAWQLISLDDDKIIAAKPPGAYGKMETPAIAYEGISLQTDWTPSTGIRELKLTILNVRGRGLDSGNWKIYSGSPIEDHLLAEGVDFEYMDILELAVTNEDLIFLMDASSSRQSEPTLHPNPDADYDGANQTTVISHDNDVNALWESLGRDDYQYIQSEDTNEKSIVIPVLVSLALALVAGLVLLVLAFRRKTPTHYDDDMMYTEPVDEETDFDEGSWNVGRNGLPEETFYDYYNTEEQQHAHDMNRNDSVSSTDTSDSSNDYIPNATDFNGTEADGNPVNGNVMYHTPSELSEITDPSNFAEGNPPHHSDNNIEEILEEMWADSSETSHHDIDSILGSLEADIMKARGIT